MTLSGLRYSMYYLHDKILSSGYCTASCIRKFQRDHEKLVGLIIISQLVCNSGGKVNGFSLPSSTVRGEKLTASLFSFCQRAPVIWPCSARPNYMPLLFHVCPCGTGLNNCISAGKKWGMASAPSQGSSCRQHATPNYGWSDQLGGWMDVKLAHLVSLVN